MEPEDEGEENPKPAVRANPPPLSASCGHRRAPKELEQLGKMLPAMEASGQHGESGAGCPQPPGMSQQLRAGAGTPALPHPCGEFGSFPWKSCNLRVSPGLPSSPHRHRVTSQSWECWSATAGAAGEPENREYSPLGLLLPPCPPHPCQRRRPKLSSHCSSPFPVFRLPFIPSLEIKEINLGLGNGRPMPPWPELSICPFVHPIHGNPVLQPEAPEGTPGIWGGRFPAGLGAPMGSGGHPGGLGGHP